MSEKPVSRLVLDKIEPMVVQHQARLRAFLFSRVHDRSAADDMAQEVFLIAIQQIEEFDSSRPAWPWLLGIARNKLFEHWRRAAREAPTDSIESFVIEQEAQRTASDEEMAAHEERLAALRACIDTLAPESRSLLEMTYNESLNSQNLAARLRRKASAIRVALHRIREWLASCIRTRLEASPA